MADIFISYVEEDGRIAAEIAARLQAAGYTTWHYEQDGVPGADYLETIGEVIDGAQAVVLVISARSLQSQQCYRELVRSAESDKALFPLLYGLKHEQFQERGPKWRQALGATTSIAIPAEGAAAIMPRLLAGLERKAARPSAGSDTPRPHGQKPVPERSGMGPKPRPEPKQRTIPIWAYPLLGILALAAVVLITRAVVRHGVEQAAWATAAASQSSQATQPTAEPAIVPAADKLAPPSLPTQAEPSPTGQPVAPTAAPTIPPSPTHTPSPAPPTPTPLPPVEIQAEPLQLLDIPYGRQILWSPDGKRIAIRASALHFLDAATFEEEYAVTSVQWPASIAFSPDGGTLAYANDLVTFLKVETWGELGTLPGSGDADALAYSPDGKLFAAAIGEVVKVWDLAAQKEILILPGTSSDALAISPDGQMLAAAGGVAGTEIKRWSLATGKELPALTGHTNWIRALDFSPDGRLLASGCVDRSVRLWDVASGQLYAVLTGHSGEVTSVAFGSDSRLLASASWDLSVKLWDTATGSELESLLGHTQWVEGVGFSPEGTILASGAGDGVRLWSIKLGGAAGAETAAEATAPEGGAVGAGGEPVPTSSAPNSISPANAAAVKGWKVIPSAGDMVAWSPDGKWLGVAGSKAVLYDATSLEPVQTFSTQLGPYELAFSPDSATLAVFSNGVTLFSLGSGVELRRLFDAGAVRSAVCSTFLGFSPDGSTLAVVDGDVVRLFDTAGGEEKNVLIAPGSFAIAYAGGGGSLFAAGWEGIVRVNAADGLPLQAFGESSRGSECLVLAPGGALLASAGIPGDAIILWDAERGSQLRTLAGNKGGVLRLAFSPDGRILASSGRDVTIRLWDVATGEQLGNLAGHAEPAQSLAFSPDGATLASAGRDRTVRLWRVSP